jgi:histidinol-phosphate aminotransferase
MSRGVMVRSITGFRFPGWIRVSMGTREAMIAFVDALEEIIG